MYQKNSWDKTPIRIVTKNSAKFTCPTHTEMGVVQDPSECSRLMEEYSCQSTYIANMVPEAGFSAHAPIAKLGRKYAFISKMC